MTCDWCDKPKATEVLKASNHGIRFTIRVHARTCKKAWTDEAAKSGTRLDS